MENKNTMTTSQMFDVIWVTEYYEGWRAYPVEKLNATRYTRADLAIDKAQHEAALYALREIATATKNFRERWIGGMSMGAADHRLEAAEYAANKVLEE